MRTYRWCTGCERRIDETLFVGALCPGCRKDSEDRAARRREITFTEEEYERMGDM